MRYLGDVDGWWDPKLQKLWEGYKTSALEKLPEEGGIREEYINGYFMDDPYEDIVPRLVSLLEEHPDLTLRDLFALCECRISPLNNEEGKSGVSSIDINERILPIEDEVERCKVVNDTIISYCTEALADRDFECTDEEDVPALKETLKDAKEGQFQNFDTFYELLGSFGGTFETANQDIALHINGGMNIDGCETECLPMMAWLIRLGLATIVVTKISELCG